MLPNFLFLAKAFSNIGPFAPSITLLNSEKSNSAPKLASLSPCKANSVALIFPLVPSGIVYNTLLFVVARVSSKSQTLIPFCSAVKLSDVATATAFACILASSKTRLFFIVFKASAIDAVLYTLTLDCSAILLLDSVVNSGATLNLKLYVRSLTFFAVKNPFILRSPVNCGMFNFNGLFFKYTKP